MRHVRADTSFYRIIHFHLVTITETNVWFLLIILKSINQWTFFYLSTE